MRNIMKRTFDIMFPIDDLLCCRVKRAKLVKISRQYLKE